LWVSKTPEVKGPEIQNTQDVVPTCTLAGCPCRVGFEAWGMCRPGHDGGRSLSGWRGQLWIRVSRLGWETRFCPGSPKCILKRRQVALGQGGLEAGLEGEAGF
jgi:hypothetical protein